MIPSEYGSSAPTSSKSVAHEVRDEQPPALVQLRAVERAREQLQLRELHRLVDAAEDAVHVGAGLDELGREPERLRRRVRVLEAARVGDEPDVERLGDLRRQLHAELPEQVADDLGRRRGVGDDQVGRRRSACCRGGGRRRRRSWRGRGAPGPGRSGARSRSRRRRATRSPMSSGSSRSTSSSGMNPNSAGSGAVPERYISASLPSARSPSAIASIEPSASPSGFSCATTRKRSFEVSAASTPSRSVERSSPPSPVSSVAPPGVTSSISFVMRMPRSTDGSYSKERCGVLFSLSSRATRACR